MRGWGLKTSFVIYPQLETQIFSNINQRYPYKMFVLTWDPYLLVRNRCTVRLSTTYVGNKSTGILIMIMIMMSQTRICFLSGSLHFGIKLYCCDEDESSELLFFFKRSVLLLLIPAAGLRFVVEP